MRWDKRITPWVWGLVSVLIAFVGFTALNEDFMYSMSPVVGTFLICLVYLTGYMAILHPILSTLIDFLVLVPRTIHDDRSSAMLQALYLTPVESRAIVKDLRAWGIGINLKHIFPSLVLLIFCTAVLIIESARYSSLGPVFRDSVCVILAILIFMFTVWRFLLATGLLSAFLPRWAWATGLSFMLWVVPILYGAGWSVYQILDFAPRLYADCCRRLDVAQTFLSYYEFLIPLVAVILFALLLEVPIQLTQRRAARYLDRRRSGVWQ
jgi:hypothetical protein